MRLSAESDLWTKRIELSFSNRCFKSRDPALEIRLPPSPTTSERILVCKPCQRFYFSRCNCLRRKLEHRTVFKIDVSLCGHSPGSTLCRVEIDLQNTSRYIVFVARQSPL